MKLIILATLLFSSSVFSQILSATQILNQIQSSYHQRFDSNGNYINDANLTNKFKSEQLQAIALLRQNKMIGRTIQIRNSAMSDLIISVSIVQEANNDLAGLLIERNKYDYPDAEAFLRLFNFPILAGGMDTLTYNGNTVINIKSAGWLNSALGGQINIKYPTDFNAEQFNQLPIQILKSTNGTYSFYKADRSGFNGIFLDIWYSIFSQNFGVKSVQFQ